MRTTFDEQPSAPLPRFVVKAKRCGFQPGIDILHLNRVDAELQTDEFLRKEAERRRAKQ